MPLLWRYLILRFLKTFFLSVFGFVAILLTMRLDEIAYFASLSPGKTNLFLFTIQQIPYILPIAFPIGALVSSILLVQDLSKAHELSAMRALGLSLRNILMPIITTSLFLSVLNFYIISEASTQSHFKAGMLKNELRSLNPLFLLQNKHIMQIKGFYFETFGPSISGESAEQVIFLSPSHHSKRLNLLIAGKLISTPREFKGEKVTLLTSKKTESDKSLDDEGNPFSENLLLENMKESSISIQDFAHLLEKKIWTINNDHLSMPLLLVRLDENKTKLQNIKASPDLSKVKHAKNEVNRTYSEIIKRFSVALAVFSFTFMGCAFGINISRNNSNKGLFITIILSAFYLMAFFAAKSLSHNLIATTLLYLSPHLIIILLSLKNLLRLGKGIE